MTRHLDSWQKSWGNVVEIQTIGNCNNYLLYSNIQKCELYSVTKPEELWAWFAKHYFLELFRNHQSKYQTFTYFTLFGTSCQLLYFPSVPYLYMRNLSKFVTLDRLKSSVEYAEKWNIYFLLMLAFILYDLIACKSTYCLWSKC